MTPTTTFSAGEPALTEEAAKVEVAAAAAAAELRNERREVSVEIGDMSWVPMIDEWAGGRICWFYRFMVGECLIVATCRLEFQTTETSVPSGRRFLTRLRLLS